MDIRRVRGLLALALLGVAVTAEVGSSAQATAPGKNGKITFRRYLNDDHSMGVVFVANADGTDARQVTQAARGVVDDQPDWSPDGSQLVFSRYAPDKPSAIFTVKADGTGLRRVSPPPGKGLVDYSMPSFAPDGRHIILTRASGGIKTYPGGDQIRHSDVVLMDLNGKHLRVLARAATYQADYEYPMLSPDGSHFLYEHARSYFADTKTRRAIVVSSTDGKQPKRLTPWSLDAGDNPDWSPDGTRILFHSYSDEDDSTQAQIFTIGADGSDRRQLTHFPDGTFVGSPSYSPDGTQIIFSTAAPDARADVLVMNADGSDPRPLVTDSAWDSAPDWGTG
jgi:Tol biopolymer transport system component